MHSFIVQALATLFCTPIRMASPALDPLVQQKYFRDEEEKEIFLRRLKRTMKLSVRQRNPNEFYNGAINIDLNQDEFKFSLVNLHNLMIQNPESKTIKDLLQSAISSLIGMS